jgi:Icc-related predicted phosphoesterase
MLAVFSDAHGDLRNIRKMGNVGAIVSCGDLLVYDEKWLSFPVHTILGNHEQYTVLEVFKKYNESFKNLTFMETAKTYKLDGFRVVGLNGIRSGKFKNLPQYYKLEDIEKMKRVNADVLITHDCPDGIGMNVRGRAVGDELIREIIESVKPKIAFCGHHHTHYESDIGNTKVICLPKLHDGYVLMDEKYDTELIKCKGNYKVYA